MTQETTQGTLVIEAADGGYYAIPRSVLEKGRIPADRIGNLEDLADRQDTRGLIDGALLPYAEGGYYFALPPQVIESYRVPEENVAEVQEVIETDVAGYGNAFGQSQGPGGPPSHSHAGGRQFGDVTIINQYNLNLGFNIAYGDGAVMTVQQLAGNTVTG
jgi:hypothetical protein